MATTGSSGNPTPPVRAIEQGVGGALPIVTSVPRVWGGGLCLLGFWEDSRVGGEGVPGPLSGLITRWRDVKGRGELGR